jgi:glycosyltransferase involved in cell wall biosynthesis
MQRLAVIIPAYNEELTVAETIRSFHETLPQAAIWVVDNNSGDATGEKARSCLAGLDCPGGVLEESRQGKGNALRRAFSEVDAEIYLLADADMTYPAGDAEKLIAPVASGKADMAVGDRHSNGGYERENSRALHGFGNNLVKTLVNRLFRAELKDILSGYRALSYRFVKSYPILVEGFEIETDMTLHALDKRFAIVELPIEYKARPKGSHSKLNTVSDGLRVLRTIGNILRYYRPLVFFGAMSLVFALLGLAAGTPVLIEYITTQIILRIPFAILATGLELIAVVLAAIGLILDSIAHQEKRNFERALIALQSERSYPK